MNEFDWIQTYLAPLAGPEGLGLLDDAALYKPRPGQDLVLTQDTMVEGVHFFDGEYGAGTGERLLAVNLSDLAAKGARPIGYLLSVMWPRHLKDRDLKKWMGGFCKGLASSQDAYGFKLFGGDTVRGKGPMTITAMLIGVVPKGEMVKRSGAQSGNDVWVTGTIGDAYLGLLAAQNIDTLFEHEPSGDDLWVWEEAFRRPTPRLIFRKALRQYATSCADVSDGLLSEARHISKASQCKMIIQLGDMPISKGAQKWCVHGGELDRRLELATGGDDYELLFTAKADDRDALLKCAEKLGLIITKIGYVSSGQDIECLDPNGNVLNLTKLGYTHS